MATRVEALSRPGAQVAGGNSMSADTGERKKRRERRKLRREKQRAENIERADKMHSTRLATTEKREDPVSRLDAFAYVGCSGWFYWKWRGQFYPVDLPTSGWFNHYAEQFDTVEINASFYSWPTVANVKAWLRQPGEKDFVYTVKVCELITHIRKFEGSETLVKDFGMIADGLLSIPATTELPLHGGQIKQHSWTTRSGASQCG